jgi:hypothetical protein
MSIFTAKRVQPYMFAISIELPMQLELYHDECVRLEVPTDTTGLNAQCSEHVNKVLKQIERTISNHVSLTAEHSADVQKHYQGRCFRPFTHEYITKELAIKHKLLTKAGIRHKNADNHILPKTENNECGCCGLDLADPQHELICKHDWTMALRHTMEKGVKHRSIKEFLTSDGVVDDLLPDITDDEPPKPRFTSTSSTQKELSQARKKYKKTAANVRRARVH